MPETQVSEACNEGGGSWLPLIEYSLKSGISLSTIRRKIKSNSIPYRLENGRYLIHFQGGREVDPTRRTFASTPTPPTKPVEAIEVLSDAFETALQKKEDRIQCLEKMNSELEEQVNELKLLVRVLEEKFKVRY